MSHFKRSTLDLPLTTFSFRICLYIFLVILPAASQTFDVGRVRVDQNWLRVSFRTPFVAPVVIVTKSTYGNTDSVLRTQHINETGFEVRVDTWEGRTMAYDDVDYVAIETGLTYNTDSGGLIEALAFRASSDYQTFSYPTTRSASPVVVCHVQSYVDIGFKLVRIRSLTSSDFEAKVDRDKLNRGTVNNETVGCLVSDLIASPETFEDRQTIARIETNVDHNWKDLEDLPSSQVGAQFQRPVFAGALSSANGGDPAVAFFQPTGDPEVMQTAVMEDLSTDAGEHTNEDIHYLAFDIVPPGIDECTDSTYPDNCDANHAICTNIDLSFLCACNSGYDDVTGDGTVCSAVSCDEVNDPQPNTLTAQVIRSDSGQTGTTTDTATFAYSCNDGYQLVGSGTPTFTCTGTAYAVSKWQGGTVPTCTAVSCDEVNDPQPNTLTAQVIRSDSGQTGTTTDTSTFTYSCNDGYQLVGSGTPTFTCTGTAYAVSEWQGGTVPTCTDINECTDPSSSHDCDALATCTNTVGSFTCACNPGAADIFPTYAGTQCTASFQVPCGETVIVSADNVGGSAAADSCGVAAGDVAVSLTFDWASQPPLVGNQVLPVRNYTVTTCGNVTNFNTSVSVTSRSSGECVGSAALDQTLCDSAGAGAGGLSEIVFNATIDEFYFVRIAGTNGGIGNFSLSVSSSCLCTDADFSLRDDVCKYDECSLGVHRCSRRTDYSNYDSGGTTDTALCTDTDASYTCSCLLGFEDTGSALGLGEDGLYCEAVKCGDQPSAPSNGALVFSDPVYTFQTLAETAFQCDAGYSLNTSQSLPASGKIECTGTAQTTATWPSLTATCEGVVCSGDSPEPPFGGVMIPDAPPNGLYWVAEDRVVFQCNSAFHSLSGISEKSCEGFDLGGGEMRAVWQNASLVPLCSDTTPPVVLCKDVTLSTDTRASSRLFQSIEDIEKLGAASASDLAEIDPMEPLRLYRPTDGTLILFPLTVQLGQTEFTAEARDSAGNTAMCSFTVTVVDEEPPFVLCPPGIFKNQVLRVLPHIDFPTDPVGYDNVDAGDVSFEFDINSGSQFGLGITIVSVVGKDSVGNSADCTFSVTVSACPVNSQRVTEDGPCLCDEGFWQDLSVQEGGGLKAAGFSSTVCNLCVQKARSKPGATHPSACFCNEGYYFVPDTTQPESSEAFWTQGRCIECPENADCFGALLGDAIQESASAISVRRRNLEEETSGEAQNDRQAEGLVEDGVEESLSDGRDSKHADAVSLSSTRKLQQASTGSSAESATTAQTVNRYDVTQHSRPRPKDGFALVSAYPEAVLVECELEEACVQSENQTLYQERNGGVQCAEGMRGPVCSQCWDKHQQPSDFQLCQACPQLGINALVAVVAFLGLQAVVLIYTGINVVVADDALHVVTWRNLFNYISLMAIFTEFELGDINLPDWVAPEVILPFDAMPGAGDLLSLQCIVQPLLIAAGWKDSDEMFIIINLFSQMKLLFTILFCTALGFLLVGIAHWAKERRQRRLGSGRRRASLQEAGGERAGEGGGEAGESEAPEAVGLTAAELRQLRREAEYRVQSERILNIWRYNFQFKKGQWKSFAVFKSVMLDCVPVYVIAYFLMFENAIEDLIALIKCEPLADGLPRVMSEAPSVRCDSQLYQKWVSVVLAVIAVLAVFIPATLAVMMLRAHRRLQGLAARELRPQFYRTFGFLAQ
eukprot:Cvel_22156.t1-p1 / transcript=Cvel_22156.t1 / gene=Cvel_22156 / organism=Chromera_velia_CCMP2878 / gene_product=Sushi, von Willebrand factor type A, EGF and, putative / transcript_product=Sushi, von Willebrand factor type A, EGF and, putative / location=Cvel_scaffold2150:12257-32681(+) / protein_length=1692 / sequence_SO=supercontig / SO=protein_coding / is_pseudo=false